jgi:hypothetical protein
MTPTSLEIAVETLYARLAGVRAVRQGEMNEFGRAIEVLRRISTRLDRPMAIVGGLAAIHYRVPVTTSDIDVVVTRDKLTEIVRVAREEGLTVIRESSEGWHVFRYSDSSGSVDIHVVPEGGRSPRDPVDAPAIPSPADLDVVGELDFASFAGWMALKLVANREKDRYHMVEALKQTSQVEWASVVQRLQGMSPRYLVEFEHLLRLAEQENQDNW